MTAPMPPGTHPPTAEPRRGVPRWAGVIFPLMALGAAGMLAVSAANRVWLPFVPAIAGAAALGLLAGLAVRWSLKHRPSVIRLAVALGALTFGLLGAGLASRGAIGIAPLVPLPTTIRWIEVAQLAAGGLCAWLALRAFPRRASSEPELPTAASETPPTRWALADPHLVEETRPTSARRRGRPPLRPSPAPAPTRLHVGRPAGPTLRDRYRLVATRLAQIVAWRPGSPNSRHRLPPIRFTGDAEDRCPYCLDLVDPRDRRGVTTCPVCHTPHHADCWAVTGMCQMPHLYGEGHAARPGASR